MRLPRRTVAALVVFSFAGWAGQAAAWGNAGHRMIGTLGVEALPKSLPAFLHDPQTIADIGEQAREPDRSRSTARTHDNYRDGAHQIDLDDKGAAMGGPALDHLPLTREDFDTQLRAVGTDSWKVGWLPYSIIDGWQQLAKDFAYWRAESYGEGVAKDPKHKAWLHQDRLRRERQIVYDLGYWAHFVGDGSQPLHVTYHYNGWGPGPNPNGYTTAKIHSPIEAAFVAHNVTLDMVRAKMTPPRDCKCAIEVETAAYLARAYQQVEPLYQLEKAGGFVDGDARGIAFNSARLAEGASEVRDLVVSAWNASDGMNVGYPVQPLADVLAGKAGDGYDLLYGKD
jgi:hypothetical protein